MPNGPTTGEIRFSQFESAAIFVLIIIFAGLFVWFSTRPNQQLFEYYLFALTATLVISGVLKAVGRYTKPGIALGGAIVIFGAIFFITKNTYEEDNSSKATIADLTRDNKDLTTQVTLKDTDLTKHNAAFIELQRKYDDLLAQDILVYTYSANEEPLTDIIIEYVARSGRVTEVEGQEHGMIHLVPSKDLLPTGTAIRVKFDASSLPAGRSSDVNREIRIDRITYRVTPLILQLYLATN
jgi:hypothetical protein